MLWPPLILNSTILRLILKRVSYLCKKWRLTIIVPDDPGERVAERRRPCFGAKFQVYSSNNLSSI